MNAPARNVSVADHSVAPPTHHEADGAPTWVTRASHLVTAITQAAAGTRLVVEANPDESLVLLPDCGARVTAGGETREVPANSLLILPPGDSTLELLGPGWVLRAFTTRQQALAARAVNAVDFVEPHADVAPLLDWPAPVDGWQLRVYDLDAALADGEKTRVFRCSNLMINIRLHAIKDIVGFTIIFNERITLPITTKSDTSAQILHRFQMLDPSLISRTQG